MNTSTGKENDEIKKETNHKCGPCEFPEGQKYLSKDGENFEEIYFMVVSQDLYWAYRIDSMFSIPE